MQVYVLNKHGQPLMPCSPARARQLLETGKAKVIKRTHLLSSCSLAALGISSLSFLV